MMSPKSRTELEQAGESTDPTTSESELNLASGLLVPSWLADIEHSWDELSNVRFVLSPENQPRPAPTESKMSAGRTSDRRDSQRYGIKVPLVFCPIYSPMANGHLAKSLNVSSRGVYFVTSHPVFVGLPIQVCLRMPARIAGALPIERVFDGRVSHIEWKNVPSGSSGVGVEFFYREPVRYPAQ
jgi:hypothetical protein